MKFYSILGIFVLLTFSIHAQTPKIKSEIKTKALEVLKSKEGIQIVHQSLDAKLPPLYIGYAYEVLLNVATLEKDIVGAKKYLDLATKQLELITIKENKRYLKADFISEFERIK